MSSFIISTISLVISLALADAAVGELTPSNWDELTWGKFIFVAMQVPKCHHCVNMKPAWTALVEKYEGHADIFIGTVDCMNATTRVLCERNFVTGFPQMMYGHPHNKLTQYEGGRELETFEAFLVANTTKFCNARHIDLCDVTQKAEIERLQALDPAELIAATEAEEAKFKEVEDEYTRASEPIYSGYSNDWAAAEKVSKVVQTDPKATDEQKKAAKKDLSTTTKHLQQGIRPKIEAPKLAKQEGYEKAYAGHLGLMKSVEVASKKASAQTAAETDDTAADTAADAAAETKDDL